MADSVTEVRESGLKMLDQGVEGLEEDAEGVLFKADEELTIQVGESAGNPLLVKAQYFAAVSVDGEREVDPLQAAMMGVEPEEDGGPPTVELDEASVFVANEEGTVGGGIIREDGAGIEEAIEKFEEEHL